MNFVQLRLTTISEISSGTLRSVIEYELPLPFLLQYSAFNGKRYACIEFCYHSRDMCQGWFQAEIFGEKLAPFLILLSLPLPPPSL